MHVSDTMIFFFKKPKNVPYFLSDFRQVSLTISCAKHVLYLSEILRSGRNQRLQFQNLNLNLQS